jgi:superfamily I DNA/RNA helicase
MNFKTSGKKVQYQQAYTVLGELETGSDVSKTLRPDPRIPDSLKYELPDGYRIVFQKVSKTNEHLALFVGSHDDAEHFLDSHKGWIFDPVKLTLKEIRFNTATEDVNNIVRSPDLQVSSRNQGVPAQVFQGITRDELIHIGLPESQIERALALADPDSVETMIFFDQIPESASNLLLSYVTGSASERAEIHALMKGEREQVSTLGVQQLQAIEQATDFFVDWADLPSDKVAFEELPFEDWMVYLHPGQKNLVDREFTGPARLRGVSGSGKTVVAVHRAREAARRNIKRGVDGKVLFITFNRSLSEFVSRLLKRLCTYQEFCQIEVATHGSWCQKYLRFRTGSLMSWTDATRDRVWRDVVARHLPRLHQSKLCLNVFSKEGITTRDSDVMFLSDEIDFIYGKFLHAEVSNYLTVERTGRGRPLGPNQRALVLSIYNDLVEGLAKEKHFDAREMPRASVTYLLKGEAPEQNYTDILVDEVQDLSDMELRVLHAIEQISGQLFLVGDGAQQIYRRGQSLRSIGINVSGRSFILRKNYRNTIEITNAATRLRTAEGIGRFDEDAAASQIMAIPSSVSGDRPCLIICANPEEERRRIVKEVQYLTSRLLLLPHQICCLARSSQTRGDLLKAFQSAGIKAHDYRADEGSTFGDSVLVSTLHNSKGHEFRAVFILGVTEGLLPFINSQEPEELEKEAALLYVAMTRAKELLYLSYSVRSANGKVIAPSRFIQDLGDSIDHLNFGV